MMWGSGYSSLVHILFFFWVVIIGAKPGPGVEDFVLGCCTFLYVQLYTLLALFLRNSSDVLVSFSKIEIIICIMNLPLYIWWT